MAKIHRNPGQYNRGATILEALVAIVILTIGGLAVATSVGSISKVQRANLDEARKINMRTFLQNNLDCSRSFATEDGQRHPTGSYPNIFDTFGNTIATGETSNVMFGEDYNLRMKMVDSKNPAAIAEVRKIGEETWEDLYEGVPVTCDCIAQPGWTDEWYASSGNIPQNGSKANSFITPWWQRGSLPTMSAGYLTINNGDRRNRAGWLFVVDYPCDLSIIEVRLRVVSASRMGKAPDRSPVLIALPIAPVSQTQHHVVYFWIHNNEVFIRGNGGGDDTRIWIDRTIDTSIWHTYRLEGDKNGNYKIMVDGLELISGSVDNRHIFSGDSQLTGGAKFPAPAIGDGTVEATGNVQYEFMRHNYKIR